MTTLLVFFVGIAIGCLLIVIGKSFCIPKPMWIMSFKKFNKPYKYISNIPGKVISKDGHELIKGDSKRFWGNIHFFLWPVCISHRFEISYTKNIKPGEFKKGDEILKKTTDPETNEILEMIILRKRISNHLLYRQAYPMYTKSLSTKELVNINTVTYPVLEITNPEKALFGISNWLEASMSCISAALRGFVAEVDLYDLNKLSSEGGSEKFNAAIQKITNVENDAHPSLFNLGVKLFKYTFEDFDPADPKAAELMNSYAQVTIAEETGRAKLKSAEKEAEVNRTLAKGEADAYETKQKKIVEWRKKYLVETGLAKVDADGNITELVPEANVRVSTEALKELSKLTGTLVMDSGGINKFLNINPTNPSKEKEE